ncbi:MAG: hypothetical protein WBE20_10725 [Candidatus Acidiferrales bacterium]
MRFHLGRHVLGLAAILFGVFTLAWHGFYVLQQTQSLASVPHRAILMYVVAAIEILAGLAIQWPKTACAGAIALGVLFSLVALTWIPGIVADPKVYANWGAFFYPFSKAAGALIVYATFAHSGSQRTSKLAQFACISFALCLVSFALEQIEFFAHTAELVPKWIPLGQNFWAVATTIAFFLAAIALLSGRLALLASRLTSAMLIGFGALIWLPVCFGNVHNIFNWSENLENLAIAGAAWIVADYLSQKRSSNAAEAQSSDPQ